MSTAEKAKAITIQQEQSAMVPASETAAIVSMIERAARDPAVDIDKMERLLGMQERVLAGHKEQDFRAALSAAQAEMRPVAADSNNPQTRSKYASYAALDRALRPIYTKHGFALSFNTEAAPVAEYVRVVCFVSCAGHKEKYQIDMPADGKGAKGGDVMTKTHATGSAMTYGQRYLLKMIFNIAVGDDIDGNETGELISEKQANEITTLVQSTKSDVTKFLAWLGVPSISDIPLSKHERALTALKAKAAS
jgi:hypothetical protein